MSALDPVAIVTAAVEACADVLDEAVADLPVDERTKNQMRAIIAMTLLAGVCVESGLTPRSPRRWYATCCPAR